MQRILEYAIARWLEVLVGLIVIETLGLSWFLLYSLLVVLVSIAMTGDYLRKLIRTTQFIQRVELTAIRRRLNISDEELAIVLDEEKRKAGPVEWARLEMEANDMLPPTKSGGSR